MPSNAFRRSSGNGASKSSGTVNSPVHKPKGRSCLLLEIGLSSAIALSACRITKVSPAST
ncbi:hypothetical protein CBP21_20275 [Fischerella thermalis WC246]|nr:hypothetical protein CBP17_16420 [Fischerella thermalis WC114]PLZ08522.1 hypothetical protein CBP18_13755 [Fischerella thermalis WC119]PLZ13041.1 hypothetical protein CBP19_10845 [Fischerella thermalis WC1110]PLZ23440.1 hypothetical protein CBP30_03485 [Fischerella thermalis WC157]PLZ41623.1 hypothetical protein CBP25_16210 [Fischerella thermalis WC527]PLZ42187.1 hypothetical protein CBP26_07765 [Fischerella thermalis WC538]PLZ47491.1 hypothetical protein CBP13_22065 [Fischerella thermalis